MQLIWVSGPTGRVVTLSVTRARVQLAALCVAGVLLLVGGVFQLLGLRMALTHVPSVAQAMGGVTSVAEVQKMEAGYSARLERLQTQLDRTQDRLQAMETARQAFFARIGLQALDHAHSDAASDATALGRGGPFRGLAPWLLTLEDRMTQTSEVLQTVDRSLLQIERDWSTRQARLQALPLALPVQDHFQISSLFGLRLDPLTHLPSLHEGTDFVAPVGTPVLATAAGRVVQAGQSGAYGLMVELAHADGLVTRYAHLQAIHVRPGQALAVGERVGSLGNTGRSTGPHLHYEVLWQGQPMQPLKAVQAWARSHS